jgi:formate dehydrogenase subunit gamma
MTEQTFDKQAAREIIARFDARPEMLVQMLHGFIECFGWISEEAKRLLADELNISRADVHGVVSYYHDFRTAAPGKHVIKVCAAEACQAMGARELEAHAKQRLADEDVTLEPVYCLGNCACSPAVMVDGKTYGRVNAERFDEIIACLEERR